jgi:ketosteroid isomerase-like protein
MSATPQPGAGLRAAMQQTNNLFVNEVVKKRNFAALEQVYTAGARILPPGAPMISGRQAIIDFWSDLVQSVNATDAVLTSVDVILAGDGVVEIGSAMLTMEPPGQAAAQLNAKYVVYWQQENGQWKWHVDIWNPNA